MSTVQCQINHPFLLKVVCDNCDKNTCYIDDEAVDEYNNQVIEPVQLEDPKSSLINN